MSSNLVKGIVVALVLFVIGAVVGLKMVKASDSPVVATVNGHEIFKKDVMAAIDAVKAQNQDKDLNTETLFPIMVDQLINDQLVAAAAAKADLANDAEVLARVETARVQIINGTYLEREVAKAVGAAAIKAEYEKIRKDNAGKKETHARHILMKSEDEAKAIIAELDGGADFSELAKKKSTGPTAASGGDLGWFREDAMVPEFTKAVFELTPGTYTKTPVKTQFGWHVVYVLDRRDVQLPEFAQVEMQLKNNLGQQALGKLITDLRATASIERFDMDGKPVKTN